MFQTDEITKEIEKTQEETSTFLNSLKGLSFDDAIAKMASSLVDFAFKLLIAILVFYAGKFIIRRLYRTINSIMVNKRVDASLTTFVLSLVNGVLYFILIITIIGILGIETSSFLALFASAGVAIGMALSGTLQNFAGGVLILLLKPYKVGDFIEAQGYTGKVKAIQIFHTIINTTDNKSIIIPNGGLSTSSINNYSKESYRRVDWTVSLAYGTDLAKAMEAILDIVKSDSRVVEKYIEDDRIRRQEALASQTQPDDDCDGQADDNCPENTPEKQSWWQRLRSRRKRHQLEFSKRMHEKEMENAGLTVNEDCSPFVGLNEMADSSINIVVRAWTASQDYWGLFFEMNRRFYTELPEKGFEFPFPQMDVHLSGELRQKAAQEATD